MISLPQSPIEGDRVDISRIGDHLVVRHRYGDLVCPIREVGIRVIDGGDAMYIEHARERVYVPSHTGWTAEKVLEVMYPQSVSPDYEHYIPDDLMKGIWRMLLESRRQHRVFEDGGPIVHLEGVIWRLTPAESAFIEFIRGYPKAGLDRFEAEIAVFDGALMLRDKKR